MSGNIIEWQERQNREPMLRRMEEKAFHAYVHEFEESIGKDFWADREDEETENDLNQRQSCPYFKHQVWPDANVYLTVGLDELDMYDGEQSVLIGYDKLPIGSPLELFLSEEMVKRITNMMTRVQYNLIRGKPATKYGARLYGDMIDAEYQSDAEPKNSMSNTNDFDDVPFYT